MGYVVAVSGSPGAGKSSLARGLGQTLGDAAAIHMDSYERMTQQPIGEVAKWLERGADFDELPVPRLAEDLERLKRGPHKYIVFETQFGRDHRATGRQIDFLIWIDTPPEIALARTLKAFTSGVLQADGGEPYRERIAWLDGYLENYLAVVRRLTLLQRDRVRAKADLIVDGSGPLDAVVRQAREAVLKRLP